VRACEMSGQRRLAALPACIVDSRMKNGSIWLAIELWFVWAGDGKRA
jgi:hypothetical protein